MSNIYEIVGDVQALESLISGLTDEETGETREITDEEKASFIQWIDENNEAFDAKFDGICKVYRNMKAIADVAAAERDALKNEMARLDKRAKARENEAERVKSLLWYAMDTLKIPKYKTALFSAGIQNTRKTAKPTSMFNIDVIPEEFLRRELMPSKIAEAIKQGGLYEKEGVGNHAKLFYRENGLEKELTGIAYVQGRALVIR
jgi:vacuolar-type H+-ATPase subunit I/STV1